MCISREEKAGLFAWGLVLLPSLVKILIDVTCFTQPGMKLAHRVLKPTNTVLLNVVDAQMRELLA